MAWTTPGYVSAGEADSGKFNTETVDNLLYLKGELGAWTVYTPSISSVGAGTNWALGNGAVAGVWKETGEVIDFRLAFQMGSTTTFGTKFLGLSVPTAAASSDELKCINSEINDASAAIFYPGSVQPVSTTVVCPAAWAANATYVNFALVTSTIPVTFATSDVITLRGSYKPA